MLQRKRIEDHSAADRHLRRIAPDDEPVAWQRGDRGLESELNKTILTGFDPSISAVSRDRIIVEDDDSGHYLRRSMVKPHARTRCQRSRGAGEKLQSRIEELSSPESARQREH